MCVWHSRIRCVCVLGRCKKKPQGNQVCGGEMHLLLNTFGAVWDAKIALRLCEMIWWPNERLIAIIKINWNLYFHPCATTSVCLSILSEFLHMYKTLSLRVAASSPHTPTKVKWKRCIIVQRWWCSTIYNIYIHICGSRTNLLPAPDHKGAIYIPLVVSPSPSLRVSRRAPREWWMHAQFLARQCAKWVVIVYMHMHIWYMARLVPTPEMCVDCTSKLRWEFGAPHYIYTKPFSQHQL